MSVNLFRNAATLIYHMDGPWLRVRSKKDESIDGVWTRGSRIRILSLASTSGLDTALLGELQTVGRAACVCVSVLCSVFSIKRR